MLERNRFRREKLHWKIVWKRVFLQRQREAKGLRAFAQSRLSVGLGITRCRYSGIGGLARDDQRGRMRQSLVHNAVSFCQTQESR